MRWLALIFVLTYTACSSTSYKYHQDEVAIANTLCSCVEEHVGEVDPNLILAIERAERQPNMEITEYIDSISPYLSALEQKSLDESIERIQYAAEDGFEECAESLVKQWPELDTMKDEDIAPLLLENMDEINCYGTRVIINALDS